MIEVSNLTKIFKSDGGNVSAVNDISLTLEDGQFASIIGKSGSGKSTLMHIMSGLDSHCSEHSMSQPEVVLLLTEKM